MTAEPSPGKPLQSSTHDQILQSPSYTMRAVSVASDEAKAIFSDQTTVLEQTQWCLSAEIPPHAPYDHPYSGPPTPYYPTACATLDQDSTSSATAAVSIPEMSSDGHQIAFSPSSVCPSPNGADAGKAFADSPICVSTQQQQQITSTDTSGKFNEQISCINPQHWRWLTQREVTAAFNALKVQLTLGDNSTTLKPINSDGIENEFVKVFIQSLGPVPKHMGYLEPIEDIVLWCAGCRIDRATLMFHHVLVLQSILESDVDPKSVIGTKSFYRVLKCLRIQNWNTAKAVAMYRASNDYDLMAVYTEWQTRYFLARDQSLVAEKEWKLFERQGRA